MQGSRPTLTGMRALLALATALGKRRINYQNTCDPQQTLTTDP